MFYLSFGIYLLVAAPHQLSYPALRADEGCPSTIAVHKPQLYTSVFLPGTFSRQILQYRWIILQLRTVQACLNKWDPEHYQMPDPIVEEINQFQLTLCSHSSCLDINQICTIPPCPNTFLPQNHSCQLDLVSFTTTLWASTSSQFFTRWRAFPSKPWTVSFSRRVLWDTVSNALLKSRQTPSSAGHFIMERDQVGQTGHVMLRGLLHLTGISISSILQWHNSTDEWMNKMVTNNLFYRLSSSPSQFMCSLYITIPHLYFIGRNPDQPSHTVTIKNR